ncbi:MAG: prenyltransferase [Bacteroidales bacterium]|nr:prenyltransferase [Bacteroidales bacterium]
MKKHSLKEWFAVTRYWSFPVSAMPVVATFAYLCSQGQVDFAVKPIAVFLLCVLGVVTLHSAGNVLSDWSDHRSGVDNEESCPVPFLVHKQFEPKEYLIFSALLFVVGCGIGVAIVLLSTPKLLIVGGIGVLLTLAYSFLKYHALGDLDIFIIFGVLTVLGTGCALTGDFCWDALVLSLPLGIITVSVLHANNTSDIESDRAAGIKTFAMLIGGKASSILYQVYMVLPFLCIIAAVVLGRLHPLALIALVAVIPAWKNFRKAGTFGSKGIAAMEGLDLGSAQLQLVFSGLLSAGLLVAAFL